jgi:hypothetical protein
MFRKLGRVGLILSLALSHLLGIVSPSAQASESALDALAPGNIFNCSSPINGLYGNTVVAGTTTTISKLEFITQSYMTAPANSIRVRVSTGAPMSASGTLVATFTQSSVASSPLDGGDKYLITFTGTANVTQGTTYYIQPSYVSSSSDQSLCLSSNSYTTLNSWDFKKSGSQYVLVWSTGTFNWSAYHKMRTTTGVPVTSAAFNSFQLTGNTNQATYGTSVAINANIAAASSVTFFAGGKRIPKCINLTTSGSAPNITVTCNWKPPRRGSIQITARSTPVDSSLTSSTSTPINILVSNRTTKR